MQVNVYAINAINNMLGAAFQAGGGSNGGPGDLLGRKLAAEANKNCGQILQTYLQEQGLGWNTVAASIHYFNAVGTDADMKLGDLPGYQGSWGPANESLLNFVQNVQNDPQVGGPIGAAVLGNNVVLASGYYYVTSHGLTVTDQAGKQFILFHEFWHVATGLNDIDMVHQFVDPNFSGTTGDASTRLNTWLSNDCY